MKSVCVYHYDAFSLEANKGNPAAVVLDSEGLTDEDMQEVAKQIGFNETAFPLKSSRADFRIRYFTPGHEMDLCGHATIGTIAAMKQHGLLEDNNEFRLCPIFHLYVYFRMYIIIYFEFCVDYIMFTTQKLIIVHPLTCEPNHPFCPPPSPLPQW